MLCDNVDGRWVCRRIDTCICMAVHLKLHCSPETITALLIGYTTIQNKSFWKVEVFLLSILIIFFPQKNSKRIKLSGLLIFRMRFKNLRTFRVARSWKWLSNFTFTFHFHALEKAMATHSSVLAWRIPGTGEPGGLLSMGSHRVGHDWSDLAAAAAAAALFL